MVGRAIEAIRTDYARVVPPSLSFDSNPQSLTPVLPSPIQVTLKVLSRGYFLLLSQISVGRAACKLARKHSAPGILAARINDYYPCVQLPQATPLPDLVRQQGAPTCSLAYSTSGRSVLIPDIGTFFATWWTGVYKKEHRFGIKMPPLKQLHTSTVLLNRVLKPDPGISRME